MSSGGAYYVYGEVQNTGDTTIMFAKITTTFYDSSDQVITTDIGYANLNYMTPGTKSGFFTVLLDTDADTESIDHYSLEVTYSDATSTPEQALTIGSHNGYVTDDYTDTLQIDGEITNNADSESTFTIIYATFYNAQGDVVAVELGFPENEDMATGATEPFEILYFDFDDRISMITSYSLTAESDDYAITAPVTGTITAAPTTTPDSTATPEATATPSESTETSPTPTVPEFPIIAALIALFVGTFCSLLLLKRKQK